MLVDGKPVLANGSIVIAPGDRPTLDFPWGATTVIISDGPQKIQLNFEVKILDLIGIDSPLGSCSIIDISTAAGQLKLRLFMHTVSGGWMNLHYTLA